MALVAIAFVAGIETTHAQVSPDSSGVRPGNRTFLEPNAPNPFSGTTRIGYSLDEPSTVTLKIYDFFYLEIVTLVDNQEQPKGRYVVEFDPRGLVTNLDSGMYFYELRANGDVQVRRMLYVH